MGNRAPEYAVEPLERFLDALKSTMRLLQVSVRGIGVLRGMPQVFEKLAQHSKPEQQAEYTANLTEAKKEAELAETECATDFPLMHAHALVGLWAALEAAIEDTLVAILMNEPDVLNKEIFSKIRIPLAEFDSLDKEERMRFLLAELARNQGRRNGVETFEVLMKHFDLSGPVDDDIKKLLWQTHHLRNVIMHRGSRTDRKLIEACPWLALALNDRVTVSHKMYRMCAEGLCAYAVMVVRRIGNRYGVAPTDSV